MRSLNAWQVKTHDFYGGEKTTCLRGRREPVQREPLTQHAVPIMLPPVKSSCRTQWSSGLYSARRWLWVTVGSREDQVHRPRDNKCLCHCQLRPRGMIWSMKGRFHPPLRTHHRRAGQMCPFLLPLFLCFVSAKETLQTTALEPLEMGGRSADGDDVVECICERGNRLGEIRIRRWIQV